MSQRKSGTPLLYLISVLSAIGAMISIWQTRLYFITRSGMGEFHSFCNIGNTFDCTAIEMSKFSEFIAGQPLSGFAVAGYFVILIVAFMGIGSETFSKNIRTFLLGLSGTAVLFSAI